MFIGSLNSMESNVSGSYTYTRRGVCTPLFPDKYPEKYSPWPMYSILQLLIRI